jgi:hypothetical protein
MGEGGFIGASAGPDKATATAITASLALMFHKDHIAETRLRFNGLLNTFPYLLQYARGNPRKETRQRTLRFAGAVMTGDLKFTAGRPYPARKFRLWLKWLSWMHFTPVDDGTGFRAIPLTLDGNPAPAGKHQADAIMEALLDALRNNGNRYEDVQFFWTANLDVTQTTVDVTRVRTAGNMISIRITVTSPDADSIQHNEWDEDDFPD